MTPKEKRMIKFVAAPAAILVLASIIVLGIRGSHLKVASSGDQEPQKEVASETHTVNTVAIAAAGASDVPLAPIVVTATNTPATNPTPSSVTPLAISAGHQKTPSSVRSLYMTACYGAQENLRNHVIDTITSNNLNAIVIDVKDYTGYVSFEMNDPRYETKGAKCVVKDMPKLLKELGDKHIYRIARITVMQDPKYADAHPETAVQWKAGGVWRDKKGLAFVDPSDKGFWDYIAGMAKASYAAGFDEVNFDYVRFPTDGNLKSATFPISEKVAKDEYKDIFTATTTKIVVVKDKKTHATSTKTVVVKPATNKRVLVSTMKAEVMKSFYQYLGGEMRKSGIPSSVDLFGLVTTAHDDLGIGQVLENAMPNFDYVAPMVYPSHYPHGSFGYGNPNTVPGPIVDKAMSGAVARAKLAGFDGSKFRTWIQDFNYGGHYGVPEIRAQIAASEKNGVNSYMVWDPKNHYTPSAYK